MPLFRFRGHDPAQLLGVEPGLVDVVVIGAGRFPGDSQKRRKLEMTMPWVKNRAVMYGGAVLLVALGALRFAGQVT